MFRYKWAFVGRPELSLNEQNPVEFVPHVLRIARIMDSKVILLNFIIIMNYVLIYKNKDIFYNKSNCIIYCSMEVQ